jgi:hypothetical protein
MCKTRFVLVILLAFAMGSISTGPINLTFRPSCTRHSPRLFLSRFFQFEVWTSKGMNDLDACCGSPRRRNIIFRIEHRVLSPLLFVAGLYDRTPYDINLLLLLVFCCKTLVFSRSMFLAEQRNFVILLPCLLCMGSMFWHNVPPIWTSILLIRFDLGSCLAMSLCARIAARKARTIVCAE